MKHTIQAVTAAPTAPRIVLDISSEPASLAANETLASIMTTPGQIKFPSTQNPSTDPNTLDDYEEGTWTPTLAFGGASVGITYASRTATYTKIGRLVNLTFDFTLTSKGSSVGSASIIGIPFTASVSGFGYVPYFNDTVGLNNGVSFVFGGTAISIMLVPGSSTVTALTDPNFTNTTRMVGAGTFTV